MILGELSSLDAFSSTRLLLKELMPGGVVCYIRQQSPFSGQLCVVRCPLSGVKQTSVPGVYKSVIKCFSIYFCNRRCFFSFVLSPDFSYPNYQTAQWSYVAILWLEAGGGVNTRAQ